MSELELEGLCPHGRLLTAVCLDCGIEAELYQPNKKVEAPKTEDVCVHGLPFDGYCAFCSPPGGSSDYYDLPEDCKTLQDIIVKKNMDFTRGNIFKAAYRWDEKPDLRYNLEKILWFANDALNRLDQQNNAGSVRKREWLE